MVVYTYSCPREDSRLYSEYQVWDIYAIDKAIHHKSMVMIQIFY